MSTAGLSPAKNSAPADRMSGAETAVREASENRRGLRYAQKSAGQTGAEKKAGKFAGARPARSPEDGVWREERTQKGLPAAVQADTGRRSPLWIGLIPLYLA